MPTLIPVPWEDMGWIQALPHLYQLPRGLTPSLRAASPSLREPRGLGTELHSSNEASSVFLTRLLSAQAIICRESHMASKDKHQHLSATSDGFEVAAKKKVSPCWHWFYIPTNEAMHTHLVVFCSRRLAASWRRVFTAAGDLQSLGVLSWTRTFLYKSLSFWDMVRKTATWRICSYGSMEFIGNLRIRRWKKFREEHSNLVTRNMKLHSGTSMVAGIFQAIHKQKSSLINQVIQGIATRVLNTPNHHG